MVVLAAPVLAVEVFDDAGAFQAAAGPLVAEDFEDADVTGDCDSAAAGSLVFGGFAVSATPAALKVLDTACVGNHNTTFGGAQYLGVDTDQAGVSSRVTLVFNGDIGAFGLNVIDLESASLEITVAGQVYTVAANGNVGESFFGIITDDPFTTVELATVGAVDSFWSMDDILSGAGTAPVSTVDWGTVKSLYR